MKQRVIACLLLLGLTLNAAYAGDGINTENDLFKIGAECIVAPVAVPVLVLKKLIERKPREAGSAIIALPLLPVMGVTLIASGVLVKAASWLPKRASSGNPEGGWLVPDNPHSVILGGSVSHRKHVVPQIEKAEPDISIDEAKLTRQETNSPRLIIGAEMDAPPPMVDFLA